MRKEFYIMPIAFFFLCLSSVSATTYIDECMSGWVINASDYYELTANLTADFSFCSGGYASCLVINTSDVTINFNGYWIIDEGGCYYGIKVLQHYLGVNATNLFQNIEIKNGGIKNFNTAGIQLNQVNDSSVHDMTILGYGIGNGIDVDNPYNSYTTIEDNYIETGDYAIKFIGFKGNKIQDNTLLSFDGIFLNGFNFDVRRNTIGFYSDNSGNATPCVRTENPMSKSITCDFCNNATIRENIIMAEEGFQIINDADKVNITQNEFLMFQNYGIGDIVPTYFSSDTTNNLFCSNVITETYLDIVDGICWWSKNSGNAYSYVNDQASNTVLANCIGGCSAMFTCNGTQKIHIGTNCLADQVYDCEYGCELGLCIGATSATTTSTTSTTTTISLVPNITGQVKAWNISWMNPIIARTDLQGASLDWLTPFLTPFFWVISGTAVFSACLTAMSKKAVVFPITILILTLVFCLFGLVDWGVGAIIIVPSFIVMATLIKKSVS